MQGQHAGRAQDHLEMLELRLDERHARQFTLADKITPRVHHHPGPVKLQAGFNQQRFLDFHTGAGFHRVDEETGDSGLDASVGVESEIGVHKGFLRGGNAIVENRVRPTGSTPGPFRTISGMTPGLRAVSDCRRGEDPPGCPSTINPWCNCLMFVFAGLVWSGKA